LRTLLSEQDVRSGVARLAAAISETYGSRPLTVIAVMTGSVMLLADLIRQLGMPLLVGVLQASSYKGGTSRGQLTINAELTPDVATAKYLRSINGLNPSLFGQCRMAVGCNIGAADASHRNN
jgi:hypoxanthine-guanine phosphoribosyltransferase